MNPQSSYVDANYSYVDVGRSFDMNTVSASPSSYYEQKPMQNNLYASNPYNFSNVQHVYSGSHASAAPYHRPMSTVGYSTDQYETPHGHEDVSRFYPSAADSQYAGSSPNKPMDGGFGYASTSNLAGYSQPTYTAPYMITQSAPYVTNVSASCGTSETYNSASHFHGVHSRTCENLTGAYVDRKSVV